MQVLCEGLGRGRCIESQHGTVHKAFRRWQGLLSAIKKAFSEEVTFGPISKNWVSYFEEGKGRSLCPAFLHNACHGTEKSYILPEGFPGLLAGPL